LGSEASEPLQAVAMKLEPDNVTQDEVFQERLSPLTCSPLQYLETSQRSELPDFEPNDVPSDQASVKQECEANEDIFRSFISEFYNLTEDA
jgi:hypothetical protein